MSWVGTASAIGLLIEVPILLRSLADSMGSVDLRHLPLGFHPTLLAALDDGVTPEAPFCLVDRYARDWWMCDREPASEISLNVTTLKECLALHWKHLPSHNVKGTPLPSQHPPPIPNCQSCRDLQHLVQDMLTEQRSLHDFTDGMETAVDAWLNSTIRRAGEFHTLHEKILLKELHENMPLATVVSNTLLTQ